MNRKLFLPAIGCVVAFLALYTTFSRASGPVVQATSSPTTSESTPTSTSTPGGERALAALRDRYVQKWQNWERSSHRLMSRAAPRSLAPTSVEMVLSPAANSDADPFQLATIAIRRHEQVQTIPCVVDAASHRVRVFDKGQWLTEEQWLEAALSTTKGMR